jgi:hypothetical protein
MKFLSEFADKIRGRRKSCAGAIKNEGEKNRKNRRFFGNPLFNVLLMATLIIGLSAVFRWLNERRMSAHTQIQFRDADDAPADGNAKNNNQIQRLEIFSGEVFNTSLRLRETGALGFAICLGVLDEARTKREIPGSINRLFGAVRERGLMPPGIKFDGDKINSASSRIFVHYKIEPMQLELVSVPLDARFGPALILRFPLQSVDGKNAAYFQAAGVSAVELPAPFAPADEVVRSGWTLESWRGIAVSGGDQDFAKMLIEEQENLNRMMGGATQTR